MLLENILDGYLSLTPDAVAISDGNAGDAAARLVYVNDGYCALFGCSAEDVLGHPVSISHDPAAWKDYAETIREHVQAGAAKFRSTTTCKRADGQTFPASVSGAICSRGADGGSYTITTYHDISALTSPKDCAGAADPGAVGARAPRVETLDAAAAEARLGAAIDTHPEPIAVYDKAFCLVSCNAAYRNRFSTDPDAIEAGQHLRDVIGHAIDCGRMAAPAEGRAHYIDAALNQMVQGDFTTDLRLPGDRHERVVQSRCANGDVMVHHLDVTDLVRERGRAEAARKRLAAAMDAYPHPIAIYGDDGQLVARNKAYSQRLSRDPAFGKGDVVSRAAAISAAPGASPAQSPKGSQAMGIALAETGDRDVHHQVLRTVSEVGDTLALWVDVTELVHERRAAEEARSRLLEAMCAYPHPFAIFDSEGALVTCNPTYAEMMVKDPSRIQPGMSYREIFEIAWNDGIIPEPPEGRQAYLDGIYEQAHEGTKSPDIEMPGDVHHRTLRHVSPTGDFMVIRMDITESVRQERRLKAAQARLISSMNAYPGPFCIYDADYRLVRFNAQYAQSITDETDTIREGMTLRDVIELGLANGSFADAVGQEREWLDALMARTEATETDEVVALKDDRHHRLLRSRTDSGDLIMVSIDITEQVRQSRALQESADHLQAANHKITYKALHDELTRLGNRSYLSERFKALSEHRAQHGGELAALHIDLDRFKQINDTLGHSAGDFILEEVAKRIRAHVEDTDVVARIGGDEFVILFWEPEASDRAKGLAYALIAEMFKPAFFDGRECRFGASIGIAQTPLADESGLLTYSDIALYKAKRAGRGQVGVFDATDIAEMRANKALADDIMRGLERAEFIPVYQPQIDARTGQVVGVEALARWDHPEKGILAPGAFLSVAEDLNVVADIDRMIFEKAMGECQHIFASMDPFPSLSFNVSANRIARDGFEDIAQHIRDYPGEISFELLETIYLEEESDAFMLQLDRLRELGISLEVDDFGSGRASVVALQRIAPERLKIDGRLVMPVVNSESSAQLVKSIIDIGSALNIGIVAECIETAEHARILTKLGADRLQGYYFSKPLSAADLKTYLNGFKDNVVPAFPTRRAGFH